jgi:hypothetical protein
MAGGELNTSAGGIHPGKPVIWPTGKSSSSSSSSNPVSSAPTTQTSGGVKTGAPAQTAPTAPAKPADTSAPAKPTPASPAPSIARPLTIEDIRAHLLKINMPDTDFNMKLASLMIKDGLELSSANMVKLLSMLGGTNKSLSLQEAAIMMLMKGVDDPKALESLGKFFSENPQMASQMAALQESMMALTTALGVSQGLLDPALVSQLGALMAQFDESLKMLNENYQFSGNNSVDANGMMNAMKSLKALLEGVQGKAQVSDSAEAQILQAGLNETLNRTNQMIENLVAQGVLSQKGREEANFIYQQVPNSEAKNPQNMEIVIKREGAGEQSGVDYENTQVVMSLQTTNLGKMVCSIIVKGKKVYVIFVFNEKDYGDEARAMISKEFANLQKNLADKSFVVTGYQVKVDPAMCAVRPYLISMLPTLEAQLRKIDLEA